MIIATTETTVVKPIKIHSVECAMGVPSPAAITGLKKEVSFCHPLNWRSVRAIGIRTDRDEVLFEILSGRYKYAVVHLTWTNERSRKFPLTHFYKGWTELYTNRLLEDHKEWQQD